MQVKAEYFKTSAVSNVNTMNLLKRAVLVYYLTTFTPEVSSVEMADERKPIQLDGGSRKKKGKKNVC
jgi:hypothetical protein